MIESTVSERFFEQFCIENSIHFERIEEEQYKTPDYEVYFGKHLVIAEVKQTDSNEDDLELQKKLHSFGIASGWEESGRRVRLKIDSAKKQLKSRAQGRYPTLLVLYNNVTTGSIDLDDIKTAMYGHEIVRYSLPEHPDDFSARIDYIGFGSDRKFTPNQNTTFSAIALLYRFGDGSLLLSVFHNIYAKKPINPSWLHCDRVKHFTLGSDVEGIFQEWREK
jgi:hypothetical protein